MALDDFAGTRIDDACAVRPAASGAVDPLDHVVAEVHGVGVFGQEFDAEGVFVAGGFEGLVPPAGAFEEGGADGFGRAAIEVIDDGFYGFAEFCGGIFFLQAVTGG